MCYNENTRVGSAERVEKNVLLIKYAYVDALVALHKLHVSSINKVEQCRRPYLLPTEVAFTGGKNVANMHIQQLRSQLLSIHSVNCYFFFFF